MGKVKKVIHLSTSKIRRGEVVVKGEELFEKYKDVQVTKPVMVYYREESKPNGVFHDFIYMTFSMPDPELYEQVLHIKAEKIYVTGEDAKGNEVKTCEEREERFPFMELLKRRMRKFGARGRILIEITSNSPVSSGWTEKNSVNFDGCVQITLNELVDVLKDHSTRYFVLSNNCWEYATHTYKKVIEKFKNHPHTTEEARNYLEDKLKKSEFPPLPSDQYKNSAITFGIVATVVFVGLQVALLYVEHPTDLAVGRCLKTAFDALLQQAKPRGLRIPLVCTKTRAWKSVYLALKWFKRLSGESPLINPVLMGKVVRILSSKVLILAGTNAIAVALAAAVLFFLCVCYGMYRKNRKKCTKGDSLV